MDFTFFKNNISRIKKTDLGGQKDQFKLAPKIRIKGVLNEKIINQAKKAAVLVLFYPDKKDKTHFLLTLRASYNGTHSSQISFPGGKFDNDDDTLKNTALRETYEEVNIAINDVSVFKQMTNVYIPPSDFLVSPFLAYVDYVPDFKKNEEVEAIISVSVEDLLNEQNLSITTVQTAYAKQLETPCLILNGYIVWGATAMMLSEIKELLKKI